MIYFIILIIFISLIGSHPRALKACGSGEYRSKEKTTAIKGIFILLIFVTHVSGYLNLDHSLANWLYILVRLALGQCVVTAFFFYSGYGIMESYKRKGEHYIDGFPLHRVLKVLLHFDLSVLLYYCVDLYIGRNVSLERFLYSLVGWSTIGNSNWFIFDTLVMYIFTYAAFKLCRQKEKAVSLITIATMIFMVFMYLYQEPRFYNTILTYPMGLTYSLCHERIEKEICRYPKRFYGILAALIALFTGYSLLIRKIVFTYEYLYIPVPLLFIVIVIMITMIYDIDNKVLRFFGSHLFEMFILMRIPMILLRHQGITNPYVFTLTSFVISVILAYFYKLLLNKIDACLHL